MTAAAPPPSWINKRQPKSDWPDWLTAYAIGRPEANGTFLIKGKLGQLRVAVGAMVFEYGGHAYSCAPGEARAILDELRAADAPVPPKPPASIHQGSLEAVAADRTDDTDEITRALRAKAGDREPIPPAKTRPPVIAALIAKPPANPVGRLAKVEASRGAMPSIEWIQLDRLLVDDSYQRSVDTGPSRALIARIGREWDWRLCVPLMVSRRPDGLYVIDGQHRWYGARLRKDVPQLPCCISVYEGPADEAAMFVAANRERRAMNRLDDFHAAKAGGDHDAIAIAGLITGAGFTVSRRTGSAAWGPGEVAFTSAIGQARRRFGEDVAREALKLLAEAFPSQRLTVGSSIFTATASVLAAPPPNFHRDQLLAALRTFDMPGWGSFINESKGGSDRAKHLREMLLEAYADAGQTNGQSERAKVSEVA